MFSSVRVLLENVDDALRAPSLCGIVEEACGGVCSLPVSSKGDAKRLLLELSSMIMDTCREFSNLADGAKENAEAMDGEGDWEDDKDDISAEDCVRLGAAVEALSKAKQVVQAVADHLPQDDEVLEIFAPLVEHCQNSITDFGVELYPPHDVRLLIEKATDLVKVLGNLKQAHNGVVLDSHFEKFTASIGLFVA